MADYYSHNDPRRKSENQALDYDTGSGSTWIWAIVALVALVALLALGSTGGPPADGTTTVVEPEATAPAAAAPTGN